MSLLTHPALPSERLPLIHGSAAKYEEMESNVPRLSRVFEYLSSQGVHQDAFLKEAAVFAMEVHMVAALDWRMTVITPQHYLGLYRRAGVLFSNDCIWNVAKREREAVVLAAASLSLSLTGARGGAAAAANSVERLGRDMALYMDECCELCVYGEWCCVCVVVLCCMLAVPAEAHPSSPPS